MLRQTAYKVHGILGGADRRLTLAQQGNIDLAQQAAAPSQCYVRRRLLAIDGQNRLFHKHAQKLLAIPVRGCGIRPDTVKIAAKRKNGGAFRFIERPGPGRFAPFKLGLGGFEFA